jgi:hypothetical protein
MRRAAPGLLIALALASCGGSAGQEPGSRTVAARTTPPAAPRTPSSLTAADLRRGAAFYAAQPKAGQLVLVRICKSRVADAAARQADKDAELAMDPGDASEDLSLEAGYRARDIVQDVDADDLRRSVGQALAANDTSIAEACRAELSAAVAKARAVIKHRVDAINSPGGQAGASEADEVPDRRQVAIKKLLRDKGAVGKSRSTVRAQLGRPDSTQDVGNQLIWYYETSANSYQVTFTNGVVDAVNRYGK